MGTSKPKHMLVSGVKLGKTIKARIHHYEFVLAAVIKSGGEHSDLAASVLNVYNPSHLSTILKGLGNANKKPRPSRMESGCLPSEVRTDGEEQG